jgi:hypothetical protein
VSNLILTTDHIVASLPADKTLHKTPRDDSQQAIHPANNEPADKTADKPTSRVFTAESTASQPAP